MSWIPGTPAGSAAADLDEESRYQATSSLDPARPGSLPVLLDRLDDPSWRVRMAAVEQLGSLPDPAPALPGLLDALSAGQSPGARNAAAAALTRMGGRAATALLERLRATTPEVRGAVVEVLGEIGDRSSAPSLSELLDDPDTNVRSAAAEALGKIGGAKAVGALLRAVGGGPEAPRLAALYALERLRVTLPVTLLGVLARDRALRRPAYRLLGLSDESAGQAILAGGAFEASRSCREAALAAIGQQCLRRPLASLGPLALTVRAAAAHSPGAAPLTAAALGSEDLTVAAGALRVLAWIGDARYAPEVAAAGEVEDLRPMVLEALQEMGPAIRASVAETLPRLSPGARVTVISALARLGDTSVFEELVGILDSEYEAVRSAAIDGLGRLGDLRAVPQLTSLLDHSDGAVAGSASAALATIASRGELERCRVVEHCRAARGRPSAALPRLLGQVGDAGDLPQLCEALKASGPSLRAAAAEGIQALAARGLVGGFLPELLETLADLGPAARAAAAQALGAMARAAQPNAAALPMGDEVARRLAAALRDSEPMVQAAAAQALGRCRLAQYGQALAELASSPRSAPEVAAAAIRALAELGHPAPAVLERAARHPDPEVVKEAVWAAAGLSAGNASELLLAAARHARWDVRRTAAQAMAARGDRSLLETVRQLAAAEEDPMAAEAFADAICALRAR